MKLYILLGDIAISILFSAYQPTAQACEEGWFGPECQYKCRCQQSCSPEGECPDECEADWFGYKCQYHLIQYKATANQSKEDITASLTDNNETTCIDIEEQSIMLDLEYLLYNPWIRLFTQQPDLLYDLKMAYIYLNSETAVATSNERFIVRQNIVDIHISVKDYIRYIIFEGQAIQGFCSVWVIAGQNVAIKQNVYYSNSSINDIDTNLPHYPQATDGVYTCNENDTGLASNYWEIVMSPSFALKYLFFYTNDVLGVFRNYTIQRFNNDGEIYAVFSSQKIQSSTSYSIVTVSNTPIKAITFSVTNWSTNKTRPLLLCEVELNAECSEGTWGVHCIKTCNKSCPDLCRFDDGLCNDGCFGFSDPPKCTRACSSGSWGVNCTNRCSNSCLELSCDSKTGFCDRGCNATNCTLIPKTSEGFSKETIITIAVSIASAVVLLIILISLMVSKVKGKLCFQRKQNVRDLPQPPVEQKDEDPYDIISKLEHEDYNSIDDNKIYNNSNAYNMPAIQSQDEQNYHLQLQGIKKENDVYSKIDDKDYEINQERNLYIDVFDPTELRASYRSVNDADDISSDLQSKGSNSTDADSYQNHIISF